MNASTVQHRCERPARVVAIFAANRHAAPDLPIEYRHLRGSGVTCIAGGCIAAAAGVVCLAYGVYPSGSSSWFSGR